MADNREMELLVASENKQEAEEYMQFLRSMSGETQKDWTNILKGVKIGLGLAAGGMKTA